MFRFANIEFLYLLLLVPLLVAVYGLASRRRHKLVERFGITRYCENSCPTSRRVVCA